jgi:hypothetical protein
MVKARCPQGCTSSSLLTGTMFYDGGRRDGPVNGADISNQLCELDRAQLNEEHDDREEREGPKVEPDHRGASRPRVLGHCGDDGGRKWRVCGWVKVIKIPLGRVMRCVNLQMNVGN